MTQSSPSLLNLIKHTAKEETTTEHRQCSAPMETIATGDNIVVSSDNETESELENTSADSIDLSPTAPMDSTNGHTLSPGPLSCSSFSNQRGHVTIAGGASAPSTVMEDILEREDSSSSLDLDAEQDEGAMSDSSSSSSVALWTSDQQQAGSSRRLSSSSITVAADPKSPLAHSAPPPTTTFEAIATRRRRRRRSHLRYAACIAIRGWLAELDKNRKNAEDRVVSKQGSQGIKFGGLDSFNGNDSSSEKYVCRMTISYC